MLIGLASPAATTLDLTLAALHFIQYLVKGPCIHGGFTQECKK